MSSSPSVSPTAIPFKRLMSLKPTRPDTFLSLTLSGWPPEGATRAFGGYVYAQAAYAASKTVAPGMVVHNVTGHFLLLGRSDLPFEYVVRRVRDGGVYCLRSVDVYQSIPADSSEPVASKKHISTTERTPCFVATISFKREERESAKSLPFAHQNAPVDYLKRHYQSVLAGKEPSDHPICPGADTIWWDNVIANNVEWLRAAEGFPGVEIRKVDMRVYNAGVIEEGKTGEWRQLCFYRIRFDEDEDLDVRAICNAATEDSKDADGEDLNLDACAHMYASDRNSLFLVQRALGFYEHAVNMASLSHTVVFHGPTQHLRMRDRDGRRKWFLQEAWTSNSGANRGCHESRLWDWEEGRIVATTLQDGMVRIAEKVVGRSGIEKL